MMAESLITSVVADSSSLEAVLAAADLPTIRAKNSMPTLAFKGVRLHSSVDPVAEAEQIVANCLSELTTALQSAKGQPITVFVLGAGLGYLIGALEKSLGDSKYPLAQVKVVCIEAESEVARKAIQLQVWKSCSLDVKWLVGSSCIESALLLQTAAARFLLTGTSSYRMNKPVYDGIIERMSGTKRAERPMRILVPTPLYGGSLPIAHYCAAAFEKLGHQVERLDLTEYYAAFHQAENITRQPQHRKSLQGMLTAYLAEVIVARALDFQCDLVWAVAQTPLTPQALLELRRRQVHTALWFVEDYRLFGYWQELAQHYDAVFTIQRGSFHDELKALGVKHVEYLPCAADPEVHYPRELSVNEQARFGSDLSFVGAGYHNRQETFAQLQLTSLKIWGNDWPPDVSASRWVQEQGRRINTEESAKIFSATKINLNLHSSPNHQGVNPYGDFVNPRTFEIAACGGFQLVDQRSELGSHFKAEEEMVVFQNTEELPELIEYYLSHETERLQIAERSRQRVLSEHTYVHRMTQALDFLQQQLPRLRDRKRGPNYVSSLLQAAGKDRELAEFLSAFDSDQEVDLDQIVARIKIGEGKLSRPEGIFLLMKEFRDWGREKGVIA
jgi:spore maturation protein CgeB